MTHRLTSICAKNYCNRTLIVKVIIENVVTCFFGTQCRMKYSGFVFISFAQHLTDFDAKSINIRFEQIH